jgi:hypothetical protein
MVGQGHFRKVLLVDKESQEEQKLLSFRVIKTCEA